MLVDFSMPVMTGDLFAKEVRQLEQTLNMEAAVIIGVSANNDTETVEKCINSGMDNFEVKPIKKAQIESLLKPFI